MRGAQRRDVELAHAEHRLRGRRGLGRVGVADEVDELRGDDLPGEAVAVLESPALRLLATVAQQLPVAVDLRLVGAGDLERDRLVEGELGPAVDPDERLAVHNACGGDQRYNLKGRFDKSDLWKPSGDRISVENLCFIEEVKLHGPTNKTKVTWKLKGEWDRDRSAKLNITLERARPGRGGTRTVATLAEGIPYRQRSVEVDLSDHRGDNLRISVRKVGDSETGGLSEPFKLP